MFTNFVRLDIRPKDLNLLIAFDVYATRSRAHDISTNIMYTRHFLNSCSRDK